MGVYGLRQLPNTLHVGIDNGPSHRVSGEKQEPEGATNFRLVRPFSLLNDRISVPSFPVSPLAIARSPSENCFLKAASAAENRIVNTARQS
jgi:hypothetical protein